MKEKHKLEILFFFIFCVIVLFGYLRRRNSDKKSKKEHFVLCGRINSIVSGKGGQWLISYSYDYNLKTIKHGMTFCTPETREKYVQGSKNILGAVEMQNPVNSELLENEADFKKFSITSEDTLGLNCVR